LNGASRSLHQLIVGNVIGALWFRAREINASWVVMPGPGVGLSDKGSDRTRCHGHFCRSALI
jgi:hypothetical protein